MLQIFTGIVRNPNISRQCIQHISRTFCYKPVERNLAASISSSMMGRIRRRRKGSAKMEYDYSSNVKPTKPPDNGRSLTIIEAISPDPNAINEQDLLNIFEKLSAGIISDNALEHENFSILIDASKLHLPKFSVSQNVRIFTQICEAQIPMFDELSEIVADALLRCISFITVDDIISLDFSLRKYHARESKLSKSFETVRQATRTSFIVKANNELVENQSYDKLIRMMRYLSNNQSLVKNVDTTSLAEQLLLKEENEFQQNDVVCVIVTLARFQKLDEHTKQLLTKMFRIWCKHAKSLEDIKSMLKLLTTNKLKNIDLTSFNDPLFIQHCSKYAIQQRNVKSGFEILDRFNEMNFISTDLIEFLSNVFNSDKYKHLKLDDYATLCTACAKANYEPINWESKIVPVIKQAPIQNTNFYKQLDLALTLNQLGIHHKEFIDNLFESADIQILYKNDTRLDEVRKAYAVDKRDSKQKTKSQLNLSTFLSWLTSDVEKFIGANKVLNNVTLGKDLTVPLVMKINTESGHFVNMEANSVKQNLICNENELIIGVLTQDGGKRGDNIECSESITKEREQMKKRGWISITIDEGLYGSMQSHKRAFTFFKIVQNAVRSRGRNSKLY